jgi:hypothetical protein
VIVMRDQLKAIYQRRMTADELKGFNGNIGRRKHRL